LCEPIELKSSDRSWPLGEQTDTEIQARFSSAIEREAEHRNLSRASLLPTQSSQRQRVTEASIEALLVGEEVTDQV
jgi:hypothetical protein